MTTTATGGVQLAVAVVEIVFWCAHQAQQPPLDVHGQICCCIMRRLQMRAWLCNIGCSCT
jgi:hypothetical protein